MCNVYNVCFLTIYLRRRANVYVVVVVVVFLLFGLAYDLVILVIRSFLGPGPWITPRKRLTSFVCKDFKSLQYDAWI